MATALSTGIGGLLRKPVCTKERFWMDLPKSYWQTPPVPPPVRGSSPSGPQLSRSRSSAEAKQGQGWRFVPRPYHSLVWLYLKAGKVLILPALSAHFTIQDHSGLSLGSCGSTRHQRRPRSAFVVQNIECQPDVRRAPPHAAWPDRHGGNGRDGIRSCLFTRRD